MRPILLSALSCLLLTACAERSINIIDNNDKIVGECIAGYDWHFYGLQDSIDYILYICAKDHLADGYRISDPSILDKDYTLPEPPQGKAWNKKLAMQHFHQGAFSEQKLGYILADIEHKFIMIRRDAEAKLSANEINQTQFDDIVGKAKKVWLGE